MAALCRFRSLVSAIPLAKMLAVPGGGAAGTAMRHNAASFTSAPCSISSRQTWGGRHFSTSTIEDCQAQIDEINDKFVEARDEIEYAAEDAESTYFNESVETARTAVAECMSRYEAVLASLGDDERSKLQRSMGLKMEQLKAELQQLEHMHT